MIRRLFSYKTNKLINREKDSAMKNGTSESLNNLENSQLNVSLCCKATLDNLNKRQWISIFKKIALNWLTRYRLSHLDDAQLKDIGLTAADVDHEVNKALWK